MRVTKKNISNIYDKLLKMFNASEFVIRDNFGEIGIICGNNLRHIKILLCSYSIVDTFHSRRLYNRYLNNYQKINGIPSNSSINEFAKCYGIDVNDVKIDIARDVIWQIKHRKIFITSINPFKIEDKLLNYALFAIDCDFMS